MSSLLGSLREQNSLVCYNTHWMTVKMSKACKQGGSVSFFKFVESTSIKHASQYSLHIDVALVVDRNDSIKLMSWEKRLFRQYSVVRVFFVIRPGR
jgi:hypothetical protein